MSRHLLANSTSSSNTPAATAIGPTAASSATQRPSTSRSYSSLSPSVASATTTAGSSGAGLGSALFDRLRPSRPRTATQLVRAAPFADGNLTSSPSLSARNARRSGFRAGFARYSFSSSQLLLADSGSSSAPSAHTNAPASGLHHFGDSQFTSTSSSPPHSPVPPSSSANNRRSVFRSSNGELTGELRPVTSSSSIMHSMTRTHSSGGVNGGGGSSSTGSALGRMFRRYSHGQHGQSRFQSQSNNMSSSADHQYSRATLPGSPPARYSAAAAAAATSTTTSSLATSTVARTSGTGPPSTPAMANYSLAATNMIPGIETLPGAIAATRETSPTESINAVPSGASPSPQSNVHRIRLVPHLEATRSLHFEPIERDLREGVPAVKIGRFTDRAPSTGAIDRAASAVGLTTQPAGAGPGNRGGAVPSSAGGGGRIDSARIAFKSKVVSRGHAELWCETGGKFFIKDTKSSSGTFLNHIRLSAPNVESKPHVIKDGDVLQLGVDYQGGTEEIYRCVKIRVELNRGWQREANQFNVNALRQLRALQGSPLPSGSGHLDVAAAAPALPTNRQTMNVTDCCICLFSVTVCQALFIAPCSHVFHYKCIRPMLNLHHPGFSCPLCRTFADLEADIEQDEEWQEALIKEAEAAEAAGARGSASLEPPTPRAERQLEELHPGHIAQSELGPNLSTTTSGWNAPSIPSSLRQQLSIVDRPFTADRPTTAVGDDPGPSALSVYGSEGGIRPNGSIDEESQEVMRDLSDGLETVRRAYPRISEESLEAGTFSSSAVAIRTAGAGGRSNPASPHRRGSQPIDIHGSTTTSNSGAGADTASDFSGFSPIDEARTPVNQHVLSVLAEAPPPRSSALLHQPTTLLSVTSTTGDETLAAPTVCLGMPSLGSGSNRFGVEEIQSFERRSSAFSEDAEFRTPAESSSVDHQNSGSAFTRHQPHAASSREGSSGSHRASPSTAGGVEQDTVETAQESGSSYGIGENGPRPSISGVAGGSLGAKSPRDTHKRDASVQSRDSQSSSIDNERAGGGGGKMKMFLKKAAGA